MVKINKIQLNKFRNFKLFDIFFNEKNNVIFGENGSGKTNILESISLIGKGKGFRNANISDLIHKKEENFLIESEVEKDLNKYDLSVFSRLIDHKYKKICTLNGKASKETSAFINSTISFLFFLPEMERLFLLSPNYRRNFIDKLIFSENKNYNKIINKYKKNIIERNKILQFNNYDSNWIIAIENEIAEIGLNIYDLRNKQISILNQELNNFNKNNNYPYIINFEIIDEFYNGDFDKAKYLTILKDMRVIDSKYGGTKIGPHKSDFNALVNNETNASLLSTGQQKTLVLMILFAQSKYLINERKIKPILLFDEICSHLDDNNRKLLLDLTGQLDIQFFFTGTEKSLFSFMSTNTNFYNISK